MHLGLWHEAYGSALRVYDLADGLLVELQPRLQRHWWYSVEVLDGSVQLGKPQEGRCGHR